MLSESKPLFRKESILLGRKCVFNNKIHLEIGKARVKNLYFLEFTKSLIDKSEMENKSCS